MQPYPWQSQQWSQIQQRIQTGTLPHALILHGIPGIGKQDFAQALTYSVLCQQTSTAGIACGQCAMCCLLQAETHPDVALIQPEAAGKAIKIEQIRQIQPLLNQTSHSNRYRVILITPAEQMNTAAANSLLKMLEEPGAGVLFILVTHQMHTVAATIISRCQIMRFPPVAAQQAASFLQQHAVQEVTDSQGAPLQVMRHLEQGYYQARKTVCDDLILLQQGQRDPVSVAQSWLEYELITVIDCVLSWMIDVCGTYFGNTKLLNQAYSQAISQWADTGDIRRYFKYYAELLTIKQQMLNQINLNKQLVLEYVLIQLTTEDKQRAIS